MNSPLVTYTKLTEKNFTSPREHAVDTITIHCTAGNRNQTAKQIVDYFYNLDRSASCNYAVGGDGSIGLCVSEADRSWCSSSGVNDHRAITIETASDNVMPYECTPQALYALVRLCTDICQRYGKTRMVWSDNMATRVNHTGQGDKDMWMTVHRDYAKKACPGDYIYSRLEDLANMVNENLLATSKPEEEQSMAKTTNIDTSKLTKIAGKSVIPQSIMEQVFKDRKIDEFLDIIPVYYEAEEHYGIRADIALCQSLLETGNFKFTGRVPKSANNFGGLGAVDSVATAYAIFPNHFLGAVAEMQHLAAYALKEDVTKLFAGWVCVDPRYELVQKGCAEYVEWLGQKENPKGKGWATGKDYGYNIMKRYNEIVEKYMKAESEPVHIDIPDFLQKSDEVEDLTKRRDTKDVWYQINPSKINVFEKADATSRVLKTIERGKIKVTEEENGFGLTEYGWIQLMWCTYVEDAE